MQHPKTWDEAKAWLDAGELEHIGESGWFATDHFLTKGKPLTNYRRKEPKRLELWAYRNINSDGQSGCWGVSKTPVFQNEFREVKQLREVIPLTDANMKQVIREGCNYAHERCCEQLGVQIQWVDAFAHHLLKATGQIE